MKPVRWLDRRLILSPVYYALCMSDKEFRAELQRLNSDMRPLFVNDGADATTHFLKRDGDMAALVCLRSCGDQVKDVAILVHEAVHIWRKICGRMGESNPSEEFEAYSIQLLTQELVGEYARRRKKRQRKK